MNATKEISILVSSIEQDPFIDFNIEEITDSNMSIEISSNNNPIQNFVIQWFSIYSLALVIIGTFGNLITIIILCRPSLRRYVTMRYLIAVSVCDILTLYGWNLNNFYKFSISKTRTNLEELSLVHCRVISYLTFVGLQLSSWYLAAVSLDRGFSLYFLTWKQKYGKLSRVKYHISILAIVCLILNSHILFLNGYRDGPPSYRVQCYKTETNSHYIFPQWERVHLIVYNLCPFTIMLSCNTYIIYVTIRSARIRKSSTVATLRRGSRSSVSRHRQLSLMLILVTFAFVFLTLPSCIYFVFFRHRMSTSKSSRNFRHMIQICLSSIQCTSHAINFFLYCYSATNFRTELNDFFNDLCLNRLMKLKLSKSNASILSRNKKNHETDISFECQHAEMGNSTREIQIRFELQNLKDNDSCQNFDATVNVY